MEIISGTDVSGRDVSPAIMFFFENAQQDIVIASFMTPPLPQITSVHLLTFDRMMNLIKAKAFQVLYLRK